MENANYLINEAILDLNISLVRQLLDEFLFDLWDDSIVLSAIESCQIDIIELLVNYGFDLNHDCYSGGYYPLEKAIEIGYSCDKIRQLLAIGANPNISSCAGTPLMSAIERNDENIIDLLIEAKVDLNCQVEGGVTALMVAASNGYIEIIKKLVKLGADPNIITVDDFPRTALVYASEFKCRETYDFLFPLTHSEEQKDCATTDRDGNLTQFGYNSSR